MDRRPGPPPNRHGWLARNHPSVLEDFIPPDWMSGVSLASPGMIPLRPEMTRDAHQKKKEERKRKKEKGEELSHTNCIRCIVTTTTSPSEYYTL